MSETSQAIVACVIIAFIFACLVIYHWDTIVKALRDPEPPPVMPDGVIDFTDEDWFFAEAHSPELLVWKPLTGEQIHGGGGYWAASREGMCHDCCQRIAKGHSIVPLGDELDKYIHYDCAKVRYRNGSL